MDNLNKINQKLLERKDVEHLLNPAFIDGVNLSKKLLTFEVLNPIKLISNPKRVDLLCKFLYVKYEQENLKTDWHIKLYKEHLRAITHFKFIEFDGCKNSFEDYKNNFDNLIQKIKSEGFDKSISIIPINESGAVLEGAHRVSICAFYNIPIRVVIINRQVNYDFNFFRTRGLKDIFQDAIMYEFCKIEKNTFVAVLNSIAYNQYKIAKDVLNEYGQVIYCKDIYLNTNGYEYLVRHIYDGEKWLGSKDNNFIGAKKYVSRAMRPHKPVKVMFLTANKLSDIRKAKLKIREIINLGNYSLHINDDHSETIWLGKVLLNNRSIQLLNKRHMPKSFKKFNNFFALYRNEIFISKLHRDNFCVSGSSVLSAFGIRDINDFDFIHNCRCIDPFVANSSGITSHNKHISQWLEVDVDDILFNPKNHFYYKGYKFLSLELLFKIKNKRKEPKDFIDLNTIKPLLGRESTLFSLFQNYINYNRIRVVIFIREFNRKLTKKLRLFLRY